MGRLFRGIFPCVIAVGPSVGAIPRQASRLQPGPRGVIFLFTKGHIIVKILQGHIKLSLVLQGIILACFLTLHLSVAAAADTIHIKPFTVYAKQDLAFLQDAMRNMMASRLAANAELQTVDDPQTADYLLEGDIIAIGEALTINAKVTTRGSSEPPETYYSSAANENEIIAAVDRLAADISAQTFGKGDYADHQAASAPVTAPTVAAPVAPASPDAPAFQTAHPDRAFIRPTTPARQAMGQRGSAFIRPATITGALGFDKTQNLDMSMQDLAVADLDGDGVDDIVLAGKNEIFLYHLNGSRLVQFASISLPDNQKILALNAADLNGNGVAEIYVSAVSDRRPMALAAEWQGSAFHYLFRDQEWYVRPVRVPGRGLLLAGQHAAIDGPFMPGIYEVSVDEGRVVRGEALPLPDQVNLFSFAMADLDGDGATEIITINQSDRLRVLRAGGKQLWQSDDFYGGSLRYVGGYGISDRHSGRTKMTAGVHEDTSRDKTYIPSRIIIADINNDHLPDVVVNKNLSTASRILKNMKSYPSGEIHGLVWTGIGLSELWRTKKIDGYVASYDFRKEAGAYQASLYVGLVTNSGWLDILAAKESTVLIYPLDLSDQEQ